MHNFIKKNFILINILSIVLLYSNINAADSTYIFDTWNQQQDTVVSSYIANSKYSTFAPQENPNYENKIYNYVITLMGKPEDKNKANIKVINVQTSPERDFLFINNKLCSVKELYAKLPKPELAAVIAELTKNYNKPVYNAGAELDIYSIDTSKTKIIIHYFKPTNKCIVYYYDINLFKNLSTGKY